ncbi:MAG: regulatory protein GemA [bacterium]
MKKRTNRPARANKKEDKTFISKAQIALLHVAKNELRLDDDIYRDMLKNVAGVSSAADMPRDKFNAMLSHLKAYGFEMRKKPGTAARKKYDELAGRAGMATPAQLRYIELQFVQYLQLKGQLHDDGPLSADDRKTVDFGLRHYLKKYFKAEDFRFLTKTAASSAIEGLKNALIHERDKQARQEVTYGATLAMAGAPLSAAGTVEPAPADTESLCGRSHAGRVENGSEKEKQNQSDRTTAGPNIRRVF